MLTIYSTYEKQNSQVCMVMDELLSAGGGSGGGGQIDFSLTIPPRSHKTVKKTMLPVSCT